VADVPGLIEGAHEGVGLGVRFLKHIERTRLVAHLVDTSDASENDPIKEFEIIENELRAFSEEVAEKPVIVVATKLDATTDRTKLEKLEAYAEKRGLPFFAISSATGEGVQKLIRGMADALDRLPRPLPPAVPDVPEAAIMESAATPEIPATPDDPAESNPHSPREAIDVGAFALAGSGVISCDFTFVRPSASRTWASALDRPFWWHI